MVNLSGSRWAPASHRTNNDNNFSRNSTSATNANNPYTQFHQFPNSTPNSTRTPSPHRQPTPLSKPQRDLLTRHSSLQKFNKLHRRLKWKSRALLYSHHRALSPHERQANVIGPVSFPMDLQPGHTAEAETMFKIDFFEYYVLLEKVLVHVLGACGLVVTAIAAVNDAKVEVDGDGLRASGMGGRREGSVAGGGEPKSLREELLEKNGLLGDSMMFHGYAHRFHANVLAALDLPGNPLREILGIGVVRDYLGIAKEFRNRWKDVEEQEGPATADGNGVLVGSRYEKMLNDLKLEEMLAAILVAVENARPVAEMELDRFARTVGTGAGFREAMMELDEVEADAPWEAMPDAMDWD